MEDVRIIRYTPEYYEDLCLYIKKTWPNKRTDDYIDYCLKGSAEDEGGVAPNLIVLNDEDQIVGCYLFFTAKAMIHGKEQLIHWGHDTFLDEAYRGDAGAMLMMEMQKIPHFGMGLSVVNKKIQRVLRTIFFKEIVLYAFLNYFFIRSLFQLILKKRASSVHLLHPGVLKIGKNCFSEVREANTLRIPNNGYWCKGEVDIDFIRDKDYLSKRFFHNFNTYYFYRLLTGEEYDSCYFVVRPIVYKKILTLSIVDFRYDLKRPEQFSLILKAVNKIARLNKIGLVLYTSNLRHRKPLIKLANSFSVLSFVPLLLRKTQAMDFIATSSLHLPSSATSVVTGADADYDFLRRDIKSLLYNQYPKV